MSYDETARALEAYTDHVRFERLVTQLLARRGLDVRPLGGSGDRGRDAVVGLYRAKGGEPLAVTISLRKDWAVKIARDIDKIVTHGFRPDDVRSVTSRQTSERRRQKLQEEIADDHQINLTVDDRRWLVTQLHRRENLDLLGEYLGLAPPRPSFFLDLAEYERLLERRGLLSSHFAGRKEAMDELERLLEVEGRAVILEAAGGFGKTRLGFELARSGRSATPWFFVDADSAFSIDYFGETEAGYPVTVLIDDAHRRADLAPLLAALERRDPVPRLVFTVRPGHAQAVQTVLARLAALPSPRTMALQAIGRSELVEVLRDEPFRIEREGMLSQLVTLSEGNVAIALIAAKLVRDGVDPTDLSQSEVFARHAEWRLAGAGLNDKPSRAAMALVAALGTLNAGQKHEAAVAAAVLEEPALVRRLDDLADAGLLVEEEPKRFTIKPDILREHILRFSCFPESGRPRLRYQDVYEAFAATRLRSLLQSLGDAQIDLAAADGTVRLVRARLFALTNEASTADELASVAGLVRALGAGGAATGLDVVELLLKKVDGLSAADFDHVGSALIDVLSAAKFGRDQLPRSWRLLLRLACLAFAVDAPATRGAAVEEIGRIYSAVPINYSPNDPYILAYVQRTVTEETRDWWEEERELAGAVEVAAAAVKPAFRFQLEQHRQSAANAMSINLTAAFVPASTETEAVVRLGARLFQETLHDLAPRAQLESLKSLDSLEHVAGGYPGMFSTWPPKDLQRLAATVLAEVEVWLADQLPRLSLPVAGAVVAHFAMRGRRPKGVMRARLGRRSGELREYLDLIDNRWRSIRIDWEKEIDEKRERGGKYGRKLLTHADWRSTLDRWNAWIEEYEALTSSAVDMFPLDAALAAVAADDAERGRDIAKYVVENELTVARYTDSLLDSLVADEANWRLVEVWKEHPSPRVRRAAARAVYRADERLARPVLTALIADEDASVVAVAWRGAVYSRTDGPRGWRLDIALDALKTNDDPLPALNQLLVVVRQRALPEKPQRLTMGQRQAIRAILLKTATEDDLASPQHLGMALKALGRQGLDLALDWLAARLGHIRRGEHQRRYLEPLPDELGPFVQASRRRVAGKAELVRLLDEAERPSTTGMYGFAVHQAIRWLGGDSAIVTDKVGEWIRGGPTLRRLALAFVTASDWKVFTKRAQILLDARPDDRQVRDFLIGVRYPRSWIGSSEPHLLAGRGFPTMEVVARPAPACPRR